MIRVHIVGDGPRDGATVPPLASGILGTEVAGTFFPWNSPPEDRGRKLRMNKTGGYSRKVEFAISRAIRDRVVGLIAVVDRDVEPAGDRLNKLHSGREAHRQANAPIPTAIGEAVPHGEAWLLNDRVAVRESLYLHDRDLDSLDDSDPKTTLGDLMKRSSRGEHELLSVLHDIASRVERSRCPNADRTGFASFADEVRYEFRDYARGGPR